MSTRFLQMMMDVQDRMESGNVPKDRHGVPRMQRIPEYIDPRTGKSILQGMRFCTIGGDVGLDGMETKCCEMCGAMNDIKVCKGCRSVYYCDRDCQRHDGHTKQACEARRKRDEAEARAKAKALTDDVD